MNTAIRLALLALAPVALVVALTYNALVVISDLLGDLLALYERAARGRR